MCCLCFFFFQAEDGIRDLIVTGVQTCALPISVRDVIHQSPQPNACLLFDASQRANWYISNRMWHSDPSRLHRMLELLVATAMRDFVPAILLQTLDDLPAGHKTRYTLSTHLSSRDLQELRLLCKESTK